MVFIFFIGFHFLPYASLFTHGRKLGNSDWNLHCFWNVRLSSFKLLRVVSEWLGQMRAALAPLRNCFGSFKDVCHLRCHASLEWAMRCELAWLRVLFVARSGPPPAGLCSTSALPCGTRELLRLCSQPPLQLTRSSSWPRYWPGFFYILSLGACRNIWGIAPVCQPEA